MSRRLNSKLRPWVICPRDIYYAAGFLGSFAKDDSFLNRCHRAPEYFTEDSLNGGFDQRLATRHGVLYHFWRRRQRTCVFRNDFVVVSRAVVQIFPHERTASGGYCCIRRLSTLVAAESSEATRDRRFRALLGSLF